MFFGKEARAGLAAWGMKHTDLGLEISNVGKPGRRSAALAPTVLRELTLEDLGKLQQDRGIKTPRIKSITDRHHAIARLLAAGTKPGEAAAILQMHPSRISTLQADPTFNELIGLYREKVDFAFTDALDHIAGLSKDAVVTLRDRLEDEPDKFSNKELLDVLTATADRSGNGPTTTQVNINANLAERLDAARKRSLAARMAEAVDVTPADLTTTGPSEVDE